MYCPNCGVEINMEGSFCAKCRKDVAYLTKPEPEEEAVPEESSQEGIPEESGEKATTSPATPTKPKSAPDKRKGFYCNHCGTFLFPEDNFCYSCGKKTRKQYYVPMKKKKKFGLF